MMLRVSTEKKLILDYNRVKLRPLSRKPQNNFTGSLDGPITEEERLISGS